MPIAVPTIAAVSSNGVSNTNADITFTFGVDGPSGIVANSLLMAFVASGFGATDFANSCAWDLASAGGVSAEVINQAGVVAHNTLSVYQRLTDGSDTSVALTSTPNSTNNGQVSKVIRIAGHALTGYIHKVAVTAAGNNVTTYAVNGVTTEVPNCLILYIVAGSGVRTWTDSGSLSEQWDFATSAPTNDKNIRVATKTQALPGATGTVTHTPSASTTCEGICIAIKPPMEGGWGEIPIN